MKRTAFAAFAAFVFFAISISGCTNTQETQAEAEIAPCNNDNQQSGNGDKGDAGGGGQGGTGGSQSAGTGGTAFHSGIQCALWSDCPPVGECWARACTEGYCEPYPDGVICSAPTPSGMGACAGGACVWSTGEACASPSDCPVDADPCRRAVCIGGKCGGDTIPNGEPSEDGGVCFWGIKRDPFACSTLLDCPPSGKECLLGVCPAGSCDYVDLTDPAVPLPIHPESGMPLGKHCR